jgi:hypothetical protein
LRRCCRWYIGRGISDASQTQRSCCGLSSAPGYWLAPPGKCRRFRQVHRPDDQAPPSGAARARRNITGPFSPISAERSEICIRNHQRPGVGLSPGISLRGRQVRKLPEAFLWSRYPVGGHCPEPGVCHIRGQLIRRRQAFVTSPSSPAHSIPGFRRMLFKLINSRDIFLCIPCLLN